MKTAIAALLLAMQPLTALAQQFPLGAGTENRQWLAERPRPENTGVRFNVSIQDGVAIAMRDGVKLDARLLLPVLPAGAAAPPPCILLANGYGRTSSNGAGAEPTLMDLASRGYAVVHLSMRATGVSGGEAGLYSRYGQDGHDAVEWMAQQPWCNGKVGMVGASLLGIAQWLTAKEGPPSLKAIIPQVACGDCYGLLWYPGGMLPGPGRLARRSSPGAEAEYDNAIAHRDLDAWWRDHITQAVDMKRIADRGVAVFMSGGVDDYITPGNVRAYEQFTSDRKRLMLAPHAHGWHVDFLQELQVQWLDHWLKGVDNGVQRESRVLLYVKGANRWRLEAAWPIIDAKPVSLAMHAASSGSIASLNDGSLGGQAGVGRGAILPYVPGRGPALPVMLSSSAGRSKADQRAAEGTVLTWTSPALSVATEVTGHPRVTLWAASNTADGDMVFSLNDVAPDGTSTQVVQGYVNVPRQASPEAPNPLTPGIARKVEIDLLPMAYVFAAGHRLRLAVAGAASSPPNWPQPQGPGANPAAFTWTVLQDAQHPATLTLPVIGTADEALARLGLSPPQPQ